MLCRFCVLVAAVLLGPLGAAGAAENAFPFGTELMLDVEPLYGSKRVPMLQIDDNGTAAIDLWCSSVHASATGDETLLTTLSQVTNWRRDGDVIELIGPTTLRFRAMTN